MDQLISVIIPIYNVEKYLKVCLESVLKQTYSNFELILVNDGSKDDCINICNTFKEIDNRIIVIDKENGGLSSARNAGLDVATGKYVTFIDSDDYVDKNYLLNLYITAIKDDFDIVQGRFIECQDDNDSLEQCIIYSKNHVKIVSREFALNNRSFKVISCGSLYRRSLYDQNRYTEGIINEDDDIYYRLVYKAKKIAMLNETLYVYRQRANSITKPTTDLMRLDFMDIYERRIVFFEEKKECRYVDGSIIRFCIVLMLTYSSKIRRKQNKEKKKLFLQAFKRNYLRINKSDVLTKPDKLMLSLFYFFPYVSSFFISLIRK